MIEITQYMLPPGTVDYNNPAFFGGKGVENALVFDSEMLSATSTKLVIQSDLFNGEIESVITGSFTVSGDDVTGTAQSIRMSYQGNVFQHWRNLNWDVEEVSRALDDIENGQADAFDKFLEQFDYKFIDHKSGGYNFLMATDGDDVVTAQVQAPGATATVFGFGGNDDIDLRNIKTGVEVVSGGGSDTVRTGKGADQIRGEGGNDVLRGGRGSDNIDGQKGRDKVFGEAGNDEYLSGGGGDDTIKGGAGQDTIIDHQGSGNKMFGGAGNDQISGRGVLDGGAGDDELIGRGRLKGGTGDDRLSGKFDKSDVFDFRLGKDASFGNDIIEVYDLNEFGPGGPGGIEELRFDAGTNIAFAFKSKKGDIVLTASDASGVVGTVTWKDFADGYTQADANNLIAGLTNDLAFV